MRLLVTGREGQVVRSLIERADGTNFEIIPLGRPELDLAGEPGPIMSAIERARPSVIVSAAADTKVDGAETEPERAFATNRDGPRAIARAAGCLRVPLIHLSTDYVFDGAKTSPYCEGDATDPTGVYGASKLAGEKAVLAEHDNSIILRTAWVYSHFGHNFVKTMLSLAGERDAVNVVSDQRGNPTSALDIADGILQLAVNLSDDNNPALRGIFHMTAAGEASWAEFAEAVFLISAEAGGPSAAVNHITTADYPTAAKRPANSALNSSKIGQLHGVRLPEWQLSLRRVVTQLVKQMATEA